MLRTSLHPRALLCAFGALISLSCASPTLPLPPPNTPDVSFESDSTVKLSSKEGALPEATVIIRNLDTSRPIGEQIEATLADERGNWTKVVKAKRGDILEITQEYRALLSPPTSFEVR
ncbi:MAG: hypothetical protein KBF88_17805 [Polyangiaceae bacterium]|nr:hypothetical protein [Polyangiaceae bacterium]